MVGCSKAAGLMSEETIKTRQFNGKEHGTHFDLDVEWVTFARRNQSREPAIPLLSIGIGMCPLESMRRYRA
jgi:hypothetical protein